MMGIVSAIAAVSLSFQFFENPFLRDDLDHFDPIIRDVHIPIGFDDNDVSQVVVEVELHNSCEEINRALVIPHPDFPEIFQIYVEGVRRQENCEAIFNRVLHPLNIGVLHEGEYQIRSYKNLHKKYGILRVRKAQTSKIDDRAYAPVDSLIIQNDETGQRRLLTLGGTFTNTCHDIENITIARTRETLIEILPSMVKRQRTDCEIKDSPFLVHQIIPTGPEERKITSGRYVLHVRTLNSASFNKIDFIKIDE